MKKTICCTVLFLMCCALSAQVTIENLLSVPFPTNLISSPDGNHIAWVFNDRGIRNVFLANAPDFIPVNVTHHRADDGIDIDQLSFSADNSYILFSQGNTSNQAGEAANPAWLQEKTGQFVWTVQVNGSGLRKISAGDNAISSPDGKMILWVTKGKVWQASPADTAKAASPLFEARGNMSDLRFSPDGNKMAFISHRKDHAFLGIYDFRLKTIEYPDPSVDTDIQPVWSPDGKWIAYIRIPGRKEVLPFTELREGSPWSIRLLDLTKGEASAIWKADYGMGSILHTDFPVSQNLLLWADGNQLVFPWERDGWQHLYALNIFSPGDARLLTPGDGEVENMNLSADRKSVIYNTNIGDSHRRHIWKLNLTERKAVQISKGNGIEWSAVNTRTGIAVLHSSATEPGWPCLISQDGTMKKIGASLFPESFPAKWLVKPELVSFPAKDHLLIHAEIFLPPGYQKEKKYPALVFLHGGSRRQMLLGFHYMGYYSNDYAMNQYYAAKGYIVLAVNYRSGIGYGMEFREALHYGANGGSEYNDVLGAGLYLQQRQDVDSKRIGLWGGSYGGYLTAMGLSRNSDIFACGVDIHGVHDWNDEMKNWVADYDPSTRAAFAKTATESSPVYFINGWKSPVLFIHGDDDRNVPFDQTINMIEKLRERKIDLEQLVFPDEIHDFLLHKNWLKAYHAAAGFFERKLK